MADNYQPKQLDENYNGGEGIGELNPFQQQSILVQETIAMENNRRLLEQQGHTKYGRVNARERSDHQNQAENQLENQAQAGPKEHPFLNASQRFDGIDPNLNPAPDIGTEARREFDNERRNQEQEKQYRLGNMPTVQRRSTPEFKP